MWSLEFDISSCKMLACILRSWCMFEGLPSWLLYPYLKAAWEFSSSTRKCILCLFWCDSAPPHLLGTFSQEASKWVVYSPFPTGSSHTVLGWTVDIDFLFCFKVSWVILTLLTEESPSVVLPLGGFTTQWPRTPGTGVLVPCGFCNKSHKLGVCLCLLGLL